MLTKNMLNEYARKTGSPLKKWVAEYLEEEIDNYEDWKKCIRDCMHDAVMNGMTPLIYNSDFETFYETFKVELSLALSFVMQELGTWYPKDIFNDWDWTDPLVVGLKNKIIMCSFGFEYAIEFILAELGIDVWEVI